MQDVDRAVAAATAVAASHGVRCDEPVLLRDGGANLVVHLAPSPVVVRIAWLTAAVRADPGRTLALESEIAVWCAGRGAPVREPAPGFGGLHRRDGFAMTFWSCLLDAAPVEGDGALLGSQLARLHEVLRDCPAPAPGPEWIAADAHRVAVLLSRLGLLEVAELTPVQEDLLDVVAAVRQVADDRRVGRRGGAVQLLHGDPHGRNATRSPDGGLVWFDLEDAWSGPVEFDLVVASGTPGVDRDDLVSAYVGAGGQAPDPDVMALCARLRRLEVITWSLLLGASDPARWEPAVAALSTYLDNR